MLSPAFLLCGNKKKKSLPKRAGNMFDHLDSAGNFTGTQAASACIYVARFAINKSFYATNVSFPGSVGTSVGVGNFDTEAYTFSAEITFGHSGTSFVLSESQRSYYIKL